MTVIRIVLLSVALALSAIGIPIPVRVTSHLQGDRRIEAVRDDGRRDHPRRGARRTRAIR